VPAATILKHNNPCGAAVGKNLVDAYERAFACDPLSAYGGVYVFNRRVDRALAERLNETFVELVFAPGYDEDAFDVLAQKPNIRILEDQERRRVSIGDHDMRRVRGGILVQDRDSETESRDEMSVVTEVRPTEEQWGDLLFAWRVCKHVRSNAIVLGKGLATVGIGAGQMSRVDAVRIAVEKAQVPLAGCAMASDAFFPFADGPELAIEAGVAAIIQPGGSTRDAEVIAACEKAGVPMVFTSRRHFRH
jgi:phosphoribosylaminoimidazolecarboxamide formyltransferase / IMP cyclohydrolase